MHLRSQLRHLPRLLLFEGLLTVVILLTGVVPLVVFNWAPVPAPSGFIRFLKIPLLALGILWLTFLFHIAVDAVRFVRNYDTYDFGDSATFVNIGFRLLATLGAVAAPVIPLILFDTGGEPPPQAGFAVVLVPALAAPVLASGLIVLFHLGWLSWTDSEVTNATW